MAGSETLKEFLVQLGFKVDENSFKKFKDNISIAGAVTFALGEGIYKTTAAMVDFAAKSSTVLEQAYFQSRRLGSSVKDIKGLEYAFGRLGVTSEEVGSALSGIRNFVLTNPGGSSYLRALGVQLEDVNDSAKTLKDLTAFVNRDTSPNKTLSSNILGQFGISPQLIQQMQEAVTLEKQHDDLLQSMGLNTQKVGEEANKLNTEMAKFDVVLGAIGQKLFGFVAIPLTKFWHDATLALQEYDALFSGDFAKSWDIAKQRGFFGLFKSAPAPGTADNGSTAGQLAAAGLPPNAVSAILGVSQGESGGKPDAVNSTSGAYGLFQFLGTRKQNLFAKYGPNPSASEQTQFALDEMFSPYSDDKQSQVVGKYLMGNHSVAEDVNMFNGSFERPGFDPNYMRKQQSAAQFSAGANITQTNNYTITGNNAQDIASAIGRQQTQTNNTLIRNTMGSAGN